MVRGKRTRVYTGIYKDAFGYAFVFKIRGVQHEKRVTFKDAPADLKAHRRALITDHLAERPDTTSLTADIDRYVATFASGRRKENARTDLSYWATAFGTRQRATITSMEIRTLLATWEQDGIAASTRNHRRQELLNLYHALDGRAAGNPVREVPRAREVYDVPREMRSDVLDLILKCVGTERDAADPKATDQPETLGLLWLQAMRYTGLPPMQLKRIELEDLDVRGRRVFIRPRRKGKGYPGVTLRLSPKATRIFKTIIARGWLGKVSRSTLAKVFKKALIRADLHWRSTHRGKPLPVPPGPITPYVLRHTFLTRVYRTTKDVKAVKEIGLHAKISTSERYIQGAVSETVDDAIAALGDT